MQNRSDTKNCTNIYKIYEGCFENKSSSSSDVAAAWPHGRAIAAAAAGQAWAGHRRGRVGARATRRRHADT